MPLIIFFESLPKIDGTSLLIPFPVKDLIELLMVVDGKSVLFFFSLSNSIDIQNKFG